LSPPELRVAIILQFHRRMNPARMEHPKLRIA